jgi:hypothetical protein
VVVVFVSNRKCWWVVALHCTRTYHTVLLARSAFVVLSGAGSVRWWLVMGRGFQRKRERKKRERFEFKTKMT